MPLLDCISNERQAIIEMPRWRRLPRVLVQVKVANVIEPNPSSYDGPASIESQTSKGP